MGKGSKSQKTTSEPWKVQQPFLEEVFNEAQGLFGMGPNFMPNDDLVVGRTDEYRRGHGLASQAAASDLTELSGMLTQGIKTQQGAVDVANNPYVQNMIGKTADLMGRDFLRNTVPGIGDAAQTAGQYGGSRHGVAEGLAASDLQSNIGQMAAEAQAQAYGQGLQALNQANMLIPTAQQAALAPAQTRMNLGLASQQQRQAVQDANLHRYMFNQDAGWQNLNNYANLVQGHYGGVSRGPSSGGGFGSGMGGALGGAQLGMMVSGGNPMGALIGGGLGLLGGLFT